MILRCGRIVSAALLGGTVSANLYGSDTRYRTTSLPLLLKILHPCDLTAIDNDLFRDAIRLEVEFLRLFRRDFLVVLPLEIGHPLTVVLRTVNG